MTDFNPNSHDAMLAKILERIDEAERRSVEYRRELKGTVDRILEQATKTNGRVTSLEDWRTSTKARLAAISAAISASIALAAWLVDHFVKQ